MNKFFSRLGGMVIAVVWISVREISGLYFRLENYIRRFRHP